MANTTGTQTAGSPVDGTTPPAETAEIRPHPKSRYVITLVAAFMINFMACGLLFGFGVYQALYESMHSTENTPFTGASAAEVDLIGSLSTSLLTLGAPFAVGWAKTFKPQLVVCAGGLIFGVAHILASFGKELWHFQLSQGLLAGIGACLAFLPSMTVTPTWFGKHRGLAMGIVSSGTGAGGLVWAPALSACIGRIGFRNTLRLTGTLSTVVLCLSATVLDWEPTTAAQLHSEKAALPGKSRLWRIPMPSLATIRERKFIAQAMAAFFQSAAYYIPVIFTVSYAKTLGLSDTDGANLTAINNACNAIGKIGVGLVADRIGRINSFFLTTLISAAATLGLWVSSTQLGADNELAGRALFITFTVLYGLFASAFVSLFSPVLAELFGIQAIPRVSGMMYMMQGTAAIIGTPVAGVLIPNDGVSRGPDDYLKMAILVGALMSAATGAVAWVRLEATKERLRAGQRMIWKL
ncbi:hypothetical protein Daus18300_006055 [Diaporthe australafricana]|uniref:Major facilitator superfamily (MFS) profile domain-containing protein n=1 Tax=Diaporthe australafricana TaxID=127596 RepID=A0ABR3WWM9_9PEZI